MSRISSTLRDLRCAHSVRVNARPGSSCTPSTCATALGTSDGSRIGARSMNQTPSAKRSSASAATCSDSRVLPRPPMPSSVSRRDDSSSLPTSSSSRSRPRNDVSCCGRLLGVDSSDRSAGNAWRSEGCSSWWISSGDARSFSRTRPSSRSVAPGWQRIGDRVDQCLRQQHLAAMRRAHDARGAIHRWTEVVVVAVLDGADVQAAAHLQADALGSRRVGERLQERECRDERVGRRVEHGEEPVAEHLDDRAAMALDRAARERVMALQRARHAIRLCFPQPGAALDVREQNGRGAGCFLHDQGLAVDRPKCASLRTGGRQCQRAAPALDDAPRRIRRRMETTM